jgi:RNA polymerase-binding transcription factor DksA
MPVLPRVAVPKTALVAGGQVLCRECEGPIPTERLQAVRTTLCVRCMENLERKGHGTVRHRMEFEVEGSDQESFESLTLHIRRA